MLPGLSWAAQAAPHPCWGTSATDSCNDPIRCGSKRGWGGPDSSSDGVLLHASRLFQKMLCDTYVWMLCGCAVPQLSHGLGRSCTSREHLFAADIITVLL